MQAERSRERVFLAQEAERQGNYVTILFEVNFLLQYIRYEKKIYDLPLIMSCANEIINT